MSENTRKEMREAFEKDYFGDLGDCPARERSGVGYKVLFVQSAWGLWQAAWTASRKAALEEAAQWNPVSERMPDREERVLVYGAKRLKWAVAEWDERDGWQSETTSEFCSMYPPTHWMPLPPPPEALASGGDGSPASTDDGQMNRMDEQSRTLGGTSKDGEHG